MVQRRVVTLTDDLDGGEAVETVCFELDGQAYEIDLSQEHATRLRDTVGGWSARARRQSAADVIREQSPQAPRLYDPKAVRAFAKARGLRVPDRGRPPKAVLEQYFAAGN